MFSNSFIIIVTAFGYLILISKEFYDFNSPFFCSLVLVSTEKIYQTFKTVFDHISKQLEVCKKYCAARRILNSLLGDLKCGQKGVFRF